MTERTLFQVQAAEMGFLRRVHGVTLRDKVRSCEIRRAVNVELLLLRIKISQLRLFRPCVQKVTRKTGEIRSAD